MRVLTVNAGSSSLKLAVVEDGRRAVIEHQVERWTSGDAGPIRPFIEQAGTVDAVAHRVVHGGERFLSATRVDDEVLTAISDLVDLAPLHQPRALSGIEATRRLLADIPEVACFDTAFHHTLPAAASTYALPEDWRRRWSLRRFGFHGLSHQYASVRAAEMIGVGSAGRVLTCHLGSGASLCAVRDGRSIDTTMGFTPLEGLVMGTRSGTVDPGLILWLISHADMEASEVSDVLEHQSGLAGLSGGQSDMREVLDLAGHGDQRGRLAVNVYLHRLAGLAAAMVASLGGVDVIAFTGGVGEHAAPIRAGLAERLAFLGVSLSGAANQGAEGDTVISADGAPVGAVVVTAREDLQMAREAEAVLSPGR